MNLEELMKMASEIVSLDVKRDQLFEELMEKSGNRGDEILRSVQNGMILRRA